MLTFRDGTAYVTYCIDQTLFCTGRQADYDWLWHFLCVDFLRFIALNAIWPHFLGIKLCFYPIFMLPKHAKENQIDAIWLGKKQKKCKIEFCFTNEHQNSYFRSWLPPLVKYYLGAHSVK